MFIRLKEIIAVICISALVIVSLTPVNAEQSYGAALPSLTDKSIYYLGDNVAGHQCLIASNFFMLRRMAVIIRKVPFCHIYGSKVLRYRKTAFR